MIIGILGPGGCGATFLDWSLHYLSGNTTKFVIPVTGMTRSTVSKEFLTQILQDPMAGTTAHGHLKTHPSNKSLIPVIEIYKTLPVDTIHSFYYVDNMSPDQTATNYDSIVEDNPDLSFITYNFTESDIDTLFCLQYDKVPMISVQLIEQTGIEHLPVWDQRELLSLYYFECIRGQTYVGTTTQYDNNFLLGFDDMMLSLDKTISDIFDFLNIKIDQTRLSDWKKIYAMWQGKNDSKFYQDLDKIVNCIVNNVDFDLSTYNLTFSKEVVIAKKLLYGHNKSLKSHNLEKILPNTMYWHSILEENMYHNLSNTKAIK